VLLRAAGATIAGLLSPELGGVVAARSGGGNKVRRRQQGLEASAAGSEGKATRSTTIELFSLFNFIERFDLADKVRCDLRCRHIDWYF